jgi:hypothetical protein
MSKYKNAATCYKVGVIAQSNALLNCNNFLGNEHAMLELYHLKKLSYL